MIGLIFVGLFLLASVMSGPYLFALVCNPRADAGNKFLCPSFGWGMFSCVTVGSWVVFATWGIFNVANVIGYNNFGLLLMSSGWVVLMVPTFCLDVYLRVFK